MRKISGLLVILMLTVLLTVLNLNRIATAIAVEGAATATLPPRAYLPLVLRNFCVGPDCPPTPTPTPTPAAGRVTVGETVAWNEGWGWTFVGLVSNGTTANVAGVRVAVDLRNSGGQIVETVVTDVPAWHIRPQGWVCWKGTAFTTGWVTYTVRVADYTVSSATWPAMQVLSASLDDAGGWWTAVGQVRNAGNTPAYDPQVTVWIRSDGILADCISEILSPNPLAAGQTTNFTLWASRNLTGTVVLGGTHASGRPMP